MSRPVLIAAGGPAMAAILHALATLPTLAARAELLAVAPAASRAALPPETLSRAALVLDEADGGHGLGLSAEERAALPHSCVRVTVPPLCFTAPWPLAGETHAAREATPFADRLAFHIARADATPEQRRAAYDSVRLSALSDLDRDLDEEANRLLARELGCDVRVAAFVLTGFRAHRLFHSPVHPAGPLLHFVAAQVLTRPAARDLLGTTLDAALLALEPALAPAFTDAQAPVHPEAAAHFNLAWWHPALEYACAGRRGGYSEWTDWRLQQGDAAMLPQPPTPPSQPPPEPAQAESPTAEMLHPAAEVARVAPFFATPIDPSVAFHGAALLNPASARYRAAPVLLATLPAAAVLGPDGAVLHGGTLLPGTVPPWGAPSPARRQRLSFPAMLGFGPGWEADTPGFATLLPRIVEFTRQRRRSPALRLILPQAARGTWLDEALALLGVADDTVIWLGAEALDCPSLLAITGLDATEVAPCLRGAALALAGMVPLGPPGPRLVYLHATGPGAPHLNAPRNAEAVAATLRARGFAVADPARLTLAQRVVLLRDARALVAAQGPALSEMAFLPTGAAVLELTGPAAPHARWWSIASCAGLRYGYVVGNALGPPDGDAPFDVPLDMLDAAAAAMMG